MDTKEIEERRNRGFENRTTYARAEFDKDQISWANSHDIPKFLEFNDLLQAMEYSDINSTATAFISSANEGEDSESHRFIVSLLFELMEQKELINEFSELMARWSDDSEQEQNQ